MAGVLVLGLRGCGVEALLWAGVGAPPPPPELDQAALLTPSLTPLIVVESERAGE